MSFRVTLQCKPSGGAYGLPVLTRRICANVGHVLTARSQGAPRALVFARGKPSDPNLRNVTNK